MANTSGSRLAHVPHLPRTRGLPTQQNWGRTGVVLKWVGGKPRSLCRHTEWLNAGIRGTTADIKTARETYPSGTIKEGEIRCAVSICTHVCVAVFQLPILKQCTNSNSQKSPNEKGALFKRWQSLWSHICSLYWIVMGTLTCKYRLNPALSMAEQTFHSSVKQHNMAGQGRVIHQSRDKDFETSTEKQNQTALPVRQVCSKSHFSQQDINLR